MDLVEGGSNMNVREPLGVVFENCALEHFETLSGFKHSTVEQDRFLGADFYMDGIPVDITLNYMGKCGKIHHLGTYKIDGVFNIKVGVRYHNNKQYLSTPVIVIGFVNEVFSHALWEIQHVDEDVFEDLFDMYWQAIDVLEETGLTLMEV